MKEGMKNKWRKRWPLFGLLFIAGMAALVGGVMLLWNALLPDITGGTVTVITYWQALGILVLSKILFGGSKFGHHKHRRCGHYNRYKEKFMHMTDEEKATFKSEMRSRWKREES